MIIVNLKKDKLVIKGHANYDNYGKDIVCASVSSIVTTSVNDIHSINKDAIKYQDNGKEVIIEIIKKDDLVDKLFQNLINLLIDLSKDYPQNIKIERED